MTDATWMNTCIMSSSAKRAVTQRRRWDPEDSCLASYDTLQGRTCKFPSVAMAMGHLKRTEINARKI